MSLKEYRPICGPKESGQSGFAVQSIVPLEKPTHVVISGEGGMPLTFTEAQDTAQDPFFRRAISSIIPYSKK